MSAATVRTRIDGALPTPTPDISNNAIALIMSQGKNGYGAVTVQTVLKPDPPAANVDERANLLDDDMIYYSRTATEATASTAGGEFDDMLIWISEYELKAKMVEAGVLPAP
jgi:hypothetical protein